MRGDRGAIVGVSLLASVALGALTAQLANGPNLEASTPNPGQAAPGATEPGIEPGDATSEPAATETCADAGLVPTSRRSGTCLAGDKTLVIAGPGEPLTVGDLEIRVLGSTFIPASTPSGRARRRARVTMRLRVVNKGDEPVPPNADGKRIYLTSAGQRVDADRAALRREGALRGDLPLGPGDASTGTLRFEIAGGFTDRARREKRLDVGVDTGSPDRVGVIRVRLPTAR